MSKAHVEVSEWDHVVVNGNCDFAQKAFSESLKAQKVKWKDRIYHDRLILSRNLILLRSKISPTGLKLIEINKL